MNCALITGASRGIGKAIAIQLAKDHGLHILINYTSNEAAAVETQNIIEANGGTAELLQFDVADKNMVDEGLNKWKEQNPEKNIHVLVNNAGITRDVSVKGMYNVTQNVIQTMLRKRRGRIINIVSVSGLKGVAGQTNYSAAKGAVIAATRSLAQEVAKRKITVNAVAPGFIKSDMTKDLDEAQLVQMIPANRFGEPEEVAHMVSFLASDKAAYITGEIININGGIHS
jgi:3-oxoacyl-[acyl-carrier protein] reductase